MSIAQRITLRQLRTFEAAARHLHFGRAAAEVHVSQPAVSIQLKQLEEMIGMPLFEQMGRRLHLTRIGEELAGHARAVLQRMHEADEALQILKGTGGGELHVAATTTAEYFAPRLLAEFRRKRSGLKIRLTVDNREAVIGLLTQNAVDLAIMGRSPRGLDTVAVPFARHPLAIVAAPDHPLRGSRRVRLAQLAHDTFLIREPGSGTRKAMASAFTAMRFQPSETIEFGSNEAIKQVVSAGMGVGFISLHTAGLELLSGRLLVLPVTGMPVMRDWYVIHRRRKKLTPVATAFRDLLLAEGSALVERATR